MLTFSPRLEHHITRGYVGFSGVVAQLIDQGVSVGDALRYSYLALLKCGHCREHEVSLRDAPITVRPIGTLEGGLASRDSAAPEVHPRYRLRGRTTALELSVEHIHY